MHPSNPSKPSPKPSQGPLAFDITAHSGPLAEWLADARVQPGVKLRFRKFLKTYKDPGSESKKYVDLIHDMVAGEWRGRHLVFKILSYVGHTCVMYCRLAYPCWVVSQCPLKLFRDMVTYDQRYHRSSHHCPTRVTAIHIVTHAA